MVEGENVKIVGWIMLALYLQDSKAYNKSFKPWLILGGTALLFDYLEGERLVNNENSMRTQSVRIEGGKT